ncbi:hypothetical protein Sme01_02220 [Sphaerisporangium melleum]|uniref:Uncharacterized protein n=1 Tax=Sphaerisporangium melleum TaxID=321316 RepID=A0A917VJY8_9ACTN|nr:hypothetical protein [Sphaerisporangium melleum]GGK88946.1 hypothetical protein GCM10007964_34550 [Sphaerisporangium melleum]GII67746.1 hypothetical protein Sme01_02220 [Sphaerisporangium melleum]
MRTGRHARGRSEEPPARQREWEPRARALDAVEPAWTVFYGVWSRRYFAIATWRANEPILVDARDPGELRSLMREAERTDIGKSAPFVAV